jgi:hypothetical protein
LIKVEAWNLPSLARRHLDFSQRCLSVDQLHQKSWYIQFFQHPAAWETPLFGSQKLALEAFFDKNIKKNGCANF